MSATAHRRYCVFTRLRPEKREEYLKLHSEVWPGVEERLRQANFTNYSIFVYEDLLVGYFEYVGANLDADEAFIAADPVTQEWWKLTDPCQLDPAPGQPGGPWRHLTEVWHLPEAAATAS